VVRGIQPQRAQGEPVFRDDAAFERTRKEAEVLVDDSPLGRLTPFKPGFTRNRLFEDIPEAVEPAQQGTFGETFNAARAAGKDVFGFDKGQGKGIEQFTTKLAEEAPVAEKPQAPPNQFKVGPILAGEFNLEAYHDKLVSAESDEDPSAVNPDPRSTATGLYQFVEKTWIDVGNKYFPEMMKDKTRNQQLEMRKDPEVSFKFFGVLTDETRRHLEGKGVPINNDTMYMAHFGGPDLAVRVFNASDTEPFSSYMSLRDIEINGFPKDMTVGSFKQWIKETIEGK
jgi:hypothetical protein